MIPIRISVVQSAHISKGDKHSCRLVLPDVQWSPAALETWNDFAGRAVVAACRTALKPVHCTYDIALYNASVPDCEGEPRARISMSDDMRTRLTACIDRAAMIKSDAESLLACMNRLATNLRGNAAAHRQIQAEVEANEEHCRKQTAEAAALLAAVTDAALCKKCGNEGGDDA